MPESTRKRVAAAEPTTGRKGGWAGFLLSDAPPLRILGWFVGVLIVTGILLRELSALLQSMHLPWQPAADLSQGPFQMLGLTGGPAEAFAVVTAWEAFLPSADALNEMAAVVVARGWLLIDVVFLVAYLLVGRALVGRGGLLRDMREGMDSILDLTAISLSLLVAIDVVENVLAWLTVDWASRPERAAEAVLGAFESTWIPEALRAVAVSKWVVALLVLVPIVVLGVVAMFRALMRAEVWNGLVVARTQILAVAVFGVAMLAPIQLPDVILGWDSVATFTALGLVSLFAVSTGVWARLLIQADLHPPDRTSAPPPARVSLAIAAVATVAAIFLWLSNGDEFRGLAVGLGLVVGVIILSIPARRIETPHRTRPAQASLRIPALLAVLPIVLLGIGIISATSAWVVFHLPGFLGRGEMETSFLTLWDIVWKPLLGLLLVIVPLGVLGPIWHHEADAAAPTWNPRAQDVNGTLGLVVLGLFAMAIPAAFVIVVVVLDPWQWGPKIGSVSIAIAALTALGYLGGVAVAATQGLVSHIGVPGAFRVFGLARIPIVTLVVLWAFINTVDIVDPVNHHDVRVADASELNNAVNPSEDQVSSVQQSLGAAFGSWVSQVVGDPDVAPCVAGPGEECVYPATPLILVAAEGGGIRAAFWTASVLDCLLEGRDGAPAGCAQGDADAPEGDSDHIFIASGASGGSVGIASYVAQTHYAETNQADWVQQTLGNDFLAPQVGWWLFAELPQALISFDAMDRAEVHERSLERAFGEEQDSPFAAGLRNLYSGATDAWVPRMMLSGSSVLDGCQVNVSYLNVGVNPRPTSDRPFPECLSLDQYSEAGVPAGVGPLAGAIDLVDMLCQDQDIRLSTAAVLSSRFPFVSPAGRLAAPECAAAAQGGIKSVKYVVDGGYVDNTGGLALASMMPSLDRSIEAYNRNIQRHGHCVVPFVVQIDNGGENPPAPGASPEIDAYSAPLQAIATASSQSRDARVKALVAGEFSRSLQHSTTTGDLITVKLDDETVLTRYARIFPAAEPALDAPLGWVLSGASQDLLLRQLMEAGSGSDEQLTGIEAARQWLGGALTCTVAPSPEVDDGR